MNLVELIEELRACSDRINTAFEQSDNPSGDKKTWLMCVIAAMSKMPEYQDSNENSSDVPDGYRKRAFVSVVDSAIKAISGNKSPEEFYADSVIENHSASKDEIQTIAQSLSNYYGFTWNDISIAITNEDLSCIDGDMLIYVSSIVEKKGQIYQALENLESKNSISESDIIPWCSAIIAVYCWTEEALKAFIADRLYRYCERWHIGDSKDYFPYFISRTSYTKLRDKSVVLQADSKYSKNKEITWSGLKDDLKKYDEEYLSGINTARYVFYGGEHRKVHPHCYRKEDGEYTTKHEDGPYILLDNPRQYVKHDEITSWYIKVGDEFIETFDMVALELNGDTNSRGGKGSPELMNFVANKLLESDSRMYNREFLDHFGLGIDCSGFVSRSLLDIMTCLQIPYPTQKTTLGPGYGRIKTNATTLKNAGCDYLFKYEKDVGENEENRISELNPGDIIMHKKFVNEEEDDLGFHIMIVKDVCDDSIEYMESSASTKLGPTGPRISKFSHTNEVRDRISLIKEGNVETRWFYARPKVFSNLSELIPFYINYLKRGEC